jgi:hypothetical protein
VSSPSKKIKPSKLSFVVLAEIVMTLGRASLSSFLFLCFHLLAPLLYTTSNAALSSSILQVYNCSTSGNYTAGGAYASNVNKFLSVLPENAISKNGGFYNGTVGEGPDTVYGLAMCPADYSRADCGDCLTAAAASNDGGLTSLCPGSTTVLAMFERCLVRYSDVDFFGIPVLCHCNFVLSPVSFTKLLYMLRQYLDSLFLFFLLTGSLIEIVGHTHCSK